MSDFYQKVANSPIGKPVVNALNLPAPAILERYSGAESVSVQGNVLLGSSKGGAALLPLAEVLSGDNVSLHLPRHIAESVKLDAEPVELDQLSEAMRFKAIVFDATGIESSQQLRELYDFFHPVIRALARCGRVLVLGQDPADCQPETASAQQALTGFSKSVGKEIGKKGATSNLLYLRKGAENNLESSVEFFTSPRSAYVSGQVVRISSSEAGQVSTQIATQAASFLGGKTALVTGASRGIGASIAEVLAGYGAKVICLDVPQAEEALNEVASAIEGIAFVQDITQTEATANISRLLAENGKGVDIVVHNAGVTRDRTLGRMKVHDWDLLMDINLSSMERINRHLLAENRINHNGRIIGVASISGIAGNFGQTNYAASKSGVIGYVHAMSKILPKGITINAVAPGFIETQMTSAIPFTIREAGRRMNSLAQGGQPEDVAQTIAYFASPRSQAINGNVVRVCGLSLIGR
ncbi:MAG: 3-oxoacyl-ACP reductase [Gammaproteobacteria bacterium]|nr:MAG: 3-oxoacyl-ACP reductase [Gammaproteobacteria bacterium]